MKLMGKGKAGWTNIGNGGLLDLYRVTHHFRCYISRFKRWESDWTCDIPRSVYNAIFQLVGNVSNGKRLKGVFQLVGNVSNGNALF